MTEKLYQLKLNNRLVDTMRESELLHYMGTVQRMAEFASENEGLPVKEVTPYYEAIELTPTETAKEIINMYAEEFTQSAFFQYWAPPKD